MPNLIFFPNTRFQQHSSPELRAVRDQILEVYAQLEEIRMAITAAASQGAVTPRIELLDHMAFDLGVANGQGAETVSELAGKG